jgi:ATP-dependent RNA helicase SUPV3L1/SUV3
MERMLGHATGMIGFPLRLLARENYDRIVRTQGVGAVALVTGEERIIPARPRWYVCTVEAMPLDRAVEFVAVDEIQLMGDPERGHIFTQRLLHARGLSETMFMGSDTVRPILKQLVPHAAIVARPRFSTLTYTGPRKVTRLPPRSAIVAFSAAEVFEFAELVRRQRGGGAVVMGALSPRARNAQVAMYQSGEVDYLVATDAIGMGLNMDLDHVAFARIAKFDGRQMRRLTAMEVAQIAGRAGRHMNNGTFGTTAEVGPLDPMLVEAVENHVFDPLRHAWWRNEALDFRSPHLLLKSLEQRPPHRVLTRVAEADDHAALRLMTRSPEIMRRATSVASVRLLWEICQIPDFRKAMSEHHARLLSQIFGYLAGPSGLLPTDWVARQLKGLDRTDGDIDALVQRIAHTRTWTYITHRPNWLHDAATWQARAIAIEDRLSDALHDRLTQRFVDRRSAALVQHLTSSRELAGAIAANGDVLVEGHHVGQMKGFRFVPDPSVDGESARTLLAAANRVLPGEVQDRARALIAAEDRAFSLNPDGAILWTGTAVAALTKGETLLRPRVELQFADYLDGALRDEVRRRIEQFVARRIDHGLVPLTGQDPALDSGPNLRGLIFRLREGLGTLATQELGMLISQLSAAERRQLSRRGIRLGAEYIYVERLLKPAAVTLKLVLWQAMWGAAPAPPPSPGRISFPASGHHRGFYELLGYPVVGPRAIRVNRLEDLANALRQRARSGAAVLDHPLAQIAGLPTDELPAIVAALGYPIERRDGKVFYGLRKTGPRSVGKMRRRATRHPLAPSEGPFSRLRDLTLSE